MCNDRHLPIWLRRKRHGLPGTREDDADDSELEQTRKPNDQTNNMMLEILTRQIWRMRVQRHLEMMNL